MCLDIVLIWDAVEHMLAELSRGGTDFTEIPPKHGNQRWEASTPEKKRLKNLEKKKQTTHITPLFH